MRVMSRVIKNSLVALALLGLAGCTTVGERYGFLKNGKEVYQRAQPLEQTVVIPQNLSSKDTEDYYEIPQGEQPSEYTKPSLAPPGSQLNTKPQPIMLSDRIRSAENAKIHGHTAATANPPSTVSLTYSQAWVKVGHVLQASNYKIVEKDRSLGTYYVIDTKATGGKVKKDMPIYQVNLKPSGNATVVTVSPGNASLQHHLNSALND